MKGSNIKSKMGRYTYYAFALLFCGSLLPGCDDDLLTGTPSWLGSSIYDELQERGTYETILRLIDDEEVSSINATTGQTEYARTLSLTGSKTLFVADDDAFDRFWESNSWGVSSYEDLTEGQKKLLFNSSMINSAYLIELMSSTSTDGDPETGTTMRRETSLSLYDTIPELTASDMPDNEYWAYYKSKYPDGSSTKMQVFRDNTVSPMVHFLPAYMSNKSITDDDLYFLTNGECSSTDESYINGQKVIESDITCQNGYIQVLENVPTPLTNMADAIRKDSDLTIFSSFLDRFCVPVYNSSLTSTLGGDSVFVWRYLNSGFEGEDNDDGTYDRLTEFNNVDFDDDEILLYDPGWNQYENGAAYTGMNEDMAVIIAPTDDAYDRYFTDGTGKVLMDRYDYIDSIPNNIIVNMLDNFMKYSLVSTVPSKFSSVMNTSNMEMDLTVGTEGGTTGVIQGGALMCNNGVVYKSNEVYSIPEYQSVSFPASLDDSIRIMRYIIEDMDYDAYLNSMESMFLFLLPTDIALRNYVDPVDYHKTQKTMTEFYYDNSSSLEGYRIKCRRYLATQNSDGTMSKGSEISNPWSTTYGYDSGTDTDDAMEDYVTNRLKDVLENSIIVQDESATLDGDKAVWVTKGTMPVILEGTGSSIQVTTGYRKEIADEYGGDPLVLEVRDVTEDSKVSNYYDMGSNPDGNGETFIFDSEPVMTASKSVLDVLEMLKEDDDRYTEFYNMLNASTLVEELYHISSSSSSSSSSSTAKTISNGPTLSIMENYNYTIYCPPTDEIQKLYDANILPDWRDVQSLETELEAAEDAYDDALAESLENEIDSLNELINDFIKYHVQNSAIYLNQAGASSTSGTYETSYMEGSRFSTLDVTNTGDNITVVCNDAEQNEISGEDARTVLEGNYLVREYRFRSGLSDDDSDNDTSSCTEISDATRIFNSSYAVIHLIDMPLLYSEEMSDAYNKVK